VRIGVVKASWKLEEGHRKPAEACTLGESLGRLRSQRGVSMLHVVLEHGEGFCPISRVCPPLGI
jgi:hypothetical protein